MADTQSAAQQVKKGDPVRLLEVEIHCATTSRSRVRINATTEEERRS